MNNTKNSTYKVNTNNSSTVVKRYKDNVFCMLYSDKRNLLDLYNALNNSSHTDIDNLTVTTLKGGTYMKYKNDASFVFSYELYMFEQQSSINFNMPLRFFHYGSEVYRDMFPNNVLHRKSMLKIPTPHFITFYNGKEKMKERVKILRLSDMFEQKTDNPELELIVTVININPEYESDNDSRTDKEEPIIGDESKDVFVKNALANADILNRCKSLRDYMTFVNKVRNKTDVYEMDVKEAVTEAVDECIKEDVLSEFFIEHREEVIAVSVFEYDEEGHMDIVREEGREEGRKEGLASGHVEERLNNLRSIMDNLGKSADEAMDIIGVKEDEREELKKMLQK